ncbi:MAG: hypothetical protein RLZZ293_951, partial [Pseudomonadota bacterium]
KKLHQLDSSIIQQLDQANFLTIYAQLKLIEPSLSYHALYDLYKVTHHDNYPTTSQQLALQQAYRNLPPIYPSLDPQLINSYLYQAEQQALLALKIDEVPIGALIVHEQQIIAYGYNQTRTQNNILAHAELIAIRQAEKYLNNHRLTECDLYVTIEPCVMCSGAILHSRIKRVIFGASEPKTGGVISQYQIFHNRQTNHHTQVIGPVDQAKYSQLLRQFFRRQ